MKKITTILFAILFASTVFAQTGVVISETNGDTPDNSAILDVKSTDKGILIPRMTVLERVAVSAPANGLMVYQTDDVSGFYYYDGSKWQIVNAWQLDENGNFKYDAGKAIADFDGADIVINAQEGGISNGTGQNGGNIILQPGIGTGTTGKKGIVEVKGELVTDVGFFQYRGEVVGYDFTSSKLTMDNNWYEFSLNGIAPPGTKAIYVNMHYQTNALGATFVFNKAITNYTKIYIQHSTTDWNTSQFIVPVSENNSIFYRINNTCNCIISIAGIVIGWWK